TGRLDVAVRDLDGALGVDADGNGEITWAELSRAAPRIADYIEHRLTLSEAGAPCALHLGQAALAELSDGAYWAVPVSATCAPPPRSLDWRSRIVRGDPDSSAGGAGDIPRVIAVGYSLLFDIDSMHRGLAHVAGQTTILRDARPVSIALDQPTSVL